MAPSIPEIEYALQLVGPDEVILNRAKPVHRPGRHQILCRVEAAGLCFSDLKLMKQFTGHPRKSGVVSGIAPALLKEIPSYVPGDLPAVPGHEAVVRVCATGAGVRSYRVGERFLVQTDYRWLRTEAANAAFGYNFEGALQEYVLMDERVITSPEGESMMIPASERLSASAVALIEPWACVEDAYAEEQRRSLRPDGRMLVVAETGAADAAIKSLLARHGRPGELTWVGARVPEALGVRAAAKRSLADLDKASCDDVVYFGASADTVEQLFAKLAPHGLLNLVLCGGRLGRKVTCPVGRVHYGGIRIVGTTGFDPLESMESIPDSGEVRPGARVHVVGAGGPMGVMHVIRALCAGVPGVTVFAADTDERRLEALSGLAAPLAEKHGASFKPYNPLQGAPEEEFDYVALMAPIPALVAQAVEQAAPGAIINIFAGIPADVTAELDLDRYIEQQQYFVGTSGSVLEDMKAVLAKVEGGRLDSNLSVAAISGLEGAAEGLRAMETRAVTGKIIVYPWCRGLGLVKLEELGQALPEVAEALENGVWNRRAEERLAQRFGYRPEPA
jgi:D-arabinose 1-dehydrogenase-like Zn-dependent alcohol dehydrogenase